MLRKHFGPQRIGPEAELENYIAENAGNVFGEKIKPFWVGVSLRIGGGIPDIILAAYKPQIIKLAGAGRNDFDTLGFLRQMGCIKLKTAYKRLYRAKKDINESFDRLVRLGVVSETGGTFILKKEWRDILPIIVTIEAKVDKWRKGLEQARRNTIFSYYSYLALPKTAAFRIRLDKLVVKSRIGILGIDFEEGLSIVRPGPFNKPRVWKYYYNIAHEVAKDLTTR